MILLYIFFELRYNYVLYTNSDPDDGKSYCRHRYCRTCRKCGRLKYLECMCVSSCGGWDGEMITYVRGPKILPFDRLPNPKRVRRSRKKPLPPLPSPILPSVLIIFVNISKYFFYLGYNTCGTIHSLLYHFILIFFRKRNGRVGILWIMLPIQIFGVKSK